MWLLNKFRLTFSHSSMHFLCIACVSSDISSSDTNGDNGVGGAEAQGRVVCCLRTQQLTYSFYFTTTESIFSDDISLLSGLT